MPLRLLREGILDSERINKLGDAAEVFYRRLMSKVDDHGLYDARPSLLRTHLYPLRVDTMTEARIVTLLQECIKAGLLRLYVVKGKQYLQMLDTNWQVRSKPKYPQPPVDNSCAQPITTAHLDVGEGVVVVEDEGGGVARTRATPTPKSKKATQTAMPAGFDAGASERVLKWAQEKGFDRIGEHLEAFVRKCRAKGYVYADWDEALMEAIREDWAKLRGPRAAPPPEHDVSRSRAIAEESEARRIADEEQRAASQTPEAIAARARVRGMLNSGVIKRAA